jgi:hypothetical protein
VLSDLTMGIRLARDLRTYLGQVHRREDCVRLLEDQLARRDESFLRLIDRSVFGNAQSPYRHLMVAGKIGFADVTQWVRRGGVEGALAELYERGVYVTLDEFKGRQPIRRAALELPVSADDFDNPLLTAHYEGQSGGSRGAGTRTRFDLGLLAHEAASDGVFLDTLGAIDRPMAIWRPALPMGAALKAVLRHAKIGILVERWFSQNDFRLSGSLWRHWFFTRASVALSRRWGRPLPIPEHLPLSEAAAVARWLADKKARGTLPYLDATVSSGVRVCQAAQQHGLDIAGTLMRIGSEPFTDARARIIRETGVRVFCSYHLAEIGRMGAPCLRPTAVDEVHIMTDKIALLQRQRVAGGGRFGALFCSTLHPAVPKMMLNVELGDYGVLGPRACGCPFEQLGFRQHLHTIRSYEKLTSEGMHFVGTELLRLIEEVLPQRFGGSATDYQLLEEDIDGLPKVSLVVSPNVGPIDEAQVVRVALETLGSARGSDKMAGVWRQTDTLRVVRREPYATRAAKVLPLHVTSGKP